MTRFERATPSSQAKCATKLRHIPFCLSGALPTSLKTILNCFVRQSATSRKNIQFSKQDYCILNKFLGQVYFLLSKKNFYAHSIYERLSRMNIGLTPNYNRIPKQNSVNFTSIYYVQNEYKDCHGVKRETQNSTGKRLDLNYRKLARIIPLRFAKFDRINIMPMNVSDGTEAYFISQPLIEELGTEEFERRISPIVSTDVCGDIIEKYPQKGLVHLFKGEAEELCVHKKPMFKQVPKRYYQKNSFYDNIPEALYELKPEYKKYFKFGTQDFQERIANMHDEGNSIVLIRNCLRQSFGDIKSATIVYMLADKLKGASLLITGDYDRGMPLFESALDDHFVEIDHNIWARRDYNPNTTKKTEITGQTENTAEYVKSQNSISKFLNKLTGIIK